MKSVDDQSFYFPSWKPLESKMDTLQNDINNMDHKISDLQYNMNQKIEHIESKMNKLQNDLNALSNDIIKCLY